jgi:hypothetical protein
MPDLKTRLYANARRAFRAGRIDEGRTLFKLAGEWGRVRFGAPHGALSRDA